jgi:hypothetical protein
MVRCSIGMLVAAFLLAPSLVLPAAPPPHGTLSWHGHGALRIGMSRRAFHAAGFALMPHAAGTAQDPSAASFDWRGCVDLPLRGAPQWQAMFEDGLLVRLVVTGPSVMTRAGVAVGFDEAQVHRPYARTLDAAGQKYDERRHNLELTSRDGRHGFVFAIEDGKVVEIRAVLADAISHDSGCPC